MNCSIKIFVSRRLDIESLAIPNPLFIPVQCGAFREHVSSLFVGDDTGDNISEKQPYYSELTVQYWAWKNHKADYYGLCHYRRFLSFSAHRYRVNERNMVAEAILSPNSIRRHCLEDIRAMRNLIIQYDAIVAEGADVNRISTPKGGLPKTVRKLWEGQDGVMIYRKDLDLLVEAIQKLYPQYSESMVEYLEGSEHIGYNCYIMRKELFVEMCNFQFTVLAELEHRIDANSYKGNLRRVFGYMGEIMYGIYVHELERRQAVRMKKMQLVYFGETRIPYNFYHKIWLLILARLTFALSHSSEIILPKGSRIRERIKHLMGRLSGYSKRKSEDIT